MSVAFSRRGVRALAVVTTSAATALVPAIGISPAHAATTKQTYRHGLWSQSHWATKAECEAGRTRTVGALNSWPSVSNVKAGACHLIDAGVGATRQLGWIYDVSYARFAPAWRGDDMLASGTSTTNLNGAHSFKIRGSYTNKADATAVETQRADAIDTTFGGRVTWRSGVEYNVVNGRYEYEINYNSRIPQYASHVEISQSPNVTSPGLGVVDPIPSTATADATSGTTSPTTSITAPNGRVMPDQLPNTVPGIDISGHTVVNDWTKWKASGVRFAYIKATEGNYYKNPQFSSQYIGATQNDVIRGAYHFANPAVSTGAQQADFALANGGGWSPDRMTLPLALDMEWNPYGDMCFNMTQAQMGKWINDFATEYKAKTGVYPMIYTASIWWNKCVGPNTDLAKMPLWIAQYNTTLGPLPQTWSLRNLQHAIWQNAAIDSAGYDTNIFNGSIRQLRQYASAGIFVKPNGV